MLAYALEDGSMWFAKLDEETLQAQGEIVQLQRELAPATAVTKLMWRPRRIGAGGRGEHEGCKKEGRYQLAVASEDASVRIYGVMMD